jgi:outer membrane PBP1 activator LpoA protein
MNITIIPANSLLWLTISAMMTLSLTGCGSTPTKSHTPAPVIDPQATQAAPIAKPIEKPAPTKPVVAPVAAEPVLVAPEPQIITPPTTENVIQTESDAVIKERQSNIRKVVVLLPDHPSLGDVNKDIESGIRKAHAYAPLNPQLQIVTIHDTLAPEQLMAKAQSYAPDWIIGPLTKADIQGIKNQLTQQQIVLNRSNETLNAMQLGMPIEDELQQLLTSTQHTHLPILVLTSNDPQEQRIIGLLNNQAQARNTPVLLLPYTTGAISDWLNHDGGISESKARIAQLGKTVHVPVNSETRVRRDIQALISVSNAKHTKSVMPSLRYYQIPWPVIASSRLLPTRKNTVFNEPDLDGVKVLTPNYLTTTLDVNNNFEAFGWDSYRLLGQPIVNNYAGMTGQLSTDAAKQYQRTLNWKPIIKGIVKDWPGAVIPTSPPPAEQ